MTETIYQGTGERTLSVGMNGADVRRLKDALFELGCYDDKITRITHDTFGADTLSAVLRFQRANDLTADGIVGVKTRAAIDAAAGLTAKPLQRGLELAQYARSRIGDLYVWGACGLYPIGEDAIRSREKTKANADRVVADWKKKTAWGMADLRGFDCSGLPSAYLMGQGIIKSKKDCDGLWAMCRPIAFGELAAGDLCFRVAAENAQDETHVGVYVGFGRVVHAKGRDCGVVLEGINQNGAGWWAKFGRLFADTPQT